MKDMNLAAGVANALSLYCPCTLTMDVSRELDMTPLVTTITIEQALVDRTPQAANKINYYSLYYEFWRPNILRAKNRYFIFVTSSQCEV